MFTSVLVCNVHAINQRFIAERICRVSPRNRKWFRFLFANETTKKMGKYLRCQVPDEKVRDQSVCAKKVPGTLWPGNGPASIVRPKKDPVSTQLVDGFFTLFFSAFKS